MTKVANEIEGFKSEVLTKGGSIQRVQNREELNERERLRKEAEDKHAAEVHARRIKAREERDLKLAERAVAQKISDEEKARKAEEQSAAKLTKEQEVEKARSQKAERKSQATNLLDDLSKAPNASLTKLSEDLDEGEVLDEFEDHEPEPIFTPVKGEVLVPAFIPALETKPTPQAHDLAEILPAPAAITVDTPPKVEIQTETAKEFIERALNPQPTGSSPDVDPGVNAEPPSSIKSKRGCERIQKMINEKHDLEKQVEDLQCTVTSLQDVIRKYEIEGKLVGNVMSLANTQKKPSELVSEAKLQMLKFLNTRSDEIDHIDKAICFNKYMSDPFYMQVFVQNNQPEQWQTMIESIYEAIGRPEPSFANVKPIATHSPQPIRARTSTLGAPLASASNPMDRIAQHLGNMGI